MVISVFALLPNDKTPLEEIPIQNDLAQSKANFWSLMFVVLALVVGFSYFFMGSISAWSAAAVSAAYRKEYFESIVFQKSTYFDDDENSQGSLTSRLANDPKQLEEMLGMNMGMVLVAFFGLSGSIAIAFAFGWKLALVGLCVTMPLGIGSMYWRFKYELGFEKMNAAVFEESSQFASESIGAFRTVSSLTLEGVIGDRYQKLLNGHVSTAYKKARWQSLIFAVSDSMTLASQALIFWYGGHLLASREYSVVSFLICLMAGIQGGEAAGQGLSFGPNAAQASAAANRILNARATKNKDHTSTGENIPQAEGGVKIELDNVHFKYPSRNVSVFKGLSITIEKGQFAALVGASGCGKTSIISLLERFYDVNQGRILVNGKDINDVNVYEYRKNLSLVAQEATLFQGQTRPRC